MKFESGLHLLDVLPVRGFWRHWQVPNRRHVFRKTPVGLRDALVASYAMSQDKILMIHSARLKYRYLWLLLCVVLGCDTQRNMAVTAHQKKTLVKASNGVQAGGDFQGLSQSNGIVGVFLLGAKDRLAVSEFHDIYVGKYDVVSEMINNLRSGFLESLSAIRRDLSLKEKELRRLRERQAEIATNLKSVWKDDLGQRSLSVSERGQYPTRSLSGLINNSLQQAKDNNQKTEQFNGTLLPIAEEIQALENAKAELENQLVAHRARFTSALFEQLQFVDADRFSPIVDEHGRFFIPVSHHHFFLWTKVATKHTGTERWRESRWFLELPASLDDAGVLGLTFENSCSESDLTME